LSAASNIFDWLSGTEHHTQRWHCSACTLINDNMDALNCSICETPRTFQERVDLDSPPNDNVDSEHKDHEQAESAVAAVAAVSQRAHSPMVSDHRPSTNNAAPPRIGRKTVSVLTWNVWFNEGLEVEQRMKSIGEHFEEHSPDIICLQEVTPRILDLLRSAPWFQRGGYSGIYRHSHPAFEAMQYFNVIMTRQEVVREGRYFKVRSLRCAECIGR